MGTIILIKKDMLSRAELRNAFNEVDTDGSDSIELGELANLCGKVSVADFDQANATELFKEIDTNHDGKISFDEFTAWYRLGRNAVLMMEKEELTLLMSSSEMVSHLRTTLIVV